jgi:hypothetical protein
MLKFPKSNILEMNLRQHENEMKSIDCLDGEILCELHHKDFAEGVKTHGAS